MGCTHCGLCLEACPTYTLWGREPDSPRGRIVLIEEALAPDGTVTPEMAQHVDACIGCMACMTVCPEDVDYGGLLTNGRLAIEQQIQRPVKERIRRRTALATLPRAARAHALRPGTSPIPHYTSARGAARGRVGLLLGCTERLLYSEIHIATLAALSAEGYEVIAPQLPDCCGALDAQAGEPGRALRRAQETIAAFAAIGGVDHIVVSAGTCGAALKQYGRVIGTSEARAFSALVVDVHELLAQSPPRAAPGRLALKIAYHDACQLRQVQGVVDAPRALLQRIPGVELVELPIDAGTCCGGFGLYPITQPAAAHQLGDRQAAAVIASGADMVVSGDHACIGQLRRGLERLGHPVAVHHPIEVIARAIAAGSSAQA
jgi:glycolate oxidase iron-sulfur subunit